MSSIVVLFASQVIPFKVHGAWLIVVAFHTTFMDDFRSCNASISV